MNSAFSFMQKAELCFQLTDCDTTTANSQVTGIGDGDPTAFIPAPNGDPSSATDSPMALRFSGGELARSVAFAFSPAFTAQETGQPSGGVGAWCTEFLGAKLLVRSTKRFGFDGSAESPARPST
jgi:hypothetical protein